MGINQLRNKLCSTGCLTISNRPVPIEHRCASWVRVEIRIEMREITFADNKVRDPITIDVGEARAMKLRERDTAGILRRKVVHHHMFDKSNLALRIPLLFVPGEPP